MDTSHRPTRYMSNYIKNELFLVEDSLSHILTVNKFHLSKTIRMREKTCDRELRNTTPKYQNASTQSRAIINTKTHKPRAFFYLNVKNVSQNHASKLLASVETSFFFFSSFFEVPR